MSKLVQNRRGKSKALVLVVSTLSIIAFGLFWTSHATNAESGKGSVPIQDVSSREPLGPSSLEQLAISEPQKPVRIEVSSSAALPPATGTPGTITGIVLSPLGLPLPGATCSLLEDDAPQGLRFGRFPRGERGDPKDQRLSGAEGAFELTAPDGYWTLQIEYDGLLTYVEESVAAGSFRRVDMQQEHQLLLHVVDTDSQPIEGAQALIIEDPFSSYAGARDTAYTDSSGTAKLALQPGVRWAVVVFAPDHISTYFDAPPFDRALLVERTVTLQEGVRISGRVVDPRTDAPPPGAVVLIDGFNPDPTQTVEVDSSGHFDAGAVFRRDFQVELTARAPGYAENRVVLDSRSSPPKTRSFTIELPLESPDAQVTGRILNTASEPIGLVDLFLQPLGPGRYLDAESRTPYAVGWRRSTTTDAQGNFKIEGLKVNYPYKLLAVPRNAYMSKLVRIPAIEAGTVHNLGKIEVLMGASLTGRVLNADGTPAVHLSLYGIMTTLADGTDPDFFPTMFGRKKDSYTNQDGQFEFAMLNTGGEYEFYWGGKYDSSHRFAVFTPEPGEHVGPIEFSLPPGGTVEQVHLRGLAQDLQGAPLGSILIELWEGPQTEVFGEGLVRGQLTDDDGVFDLEVTANKQFRLTATDLRGRYLKTSQQVLSTDTETNLWIEMTPSASSPERLEGVVTDASGTPLAGIDVTLHLSPLLVQCSCLSWNDTTDAQGRFTFGRVTDGHHRIAVVDPTGMREAQMIPVEPGETITVTMTPRASRSH